MKQLFISVVLAVFLVGCDEKPKFSINQSDTPETYANNPAFTKIKIVNNNSYKMVTDSEIGYQFAAAPTTVYGIETSDLNLLGGTILMAGNKRLINTMLTIKGKENFSRLEERLNKSKDFTCDKVDFGESKVLQCMPNPDQDKAIFNISYNPFSDIVSFSYTKLPN